MRSATALSSGTSDAPSTRFRVTLRFEEPVLTLRIFVPSAIFSPVTLSIRASFLLLFG
jgi:hypothetical protein